MELRRRNITEPYDIWLHSGGKKKSGKLHPSSKRTKKNPLPHPGQSYRPDPDDHKKLLQKVAEKELVYQKKKKSLRKAFEKKINATELQKNEKEELESGIKHLIKDTTIEKSGKSSDNSGGESTDAAFSDYDEKDFEAIVKDKRVQEKRKSRQQRHKQLRDKLQRKAAKLRKAKNIRLSKFDGIKKINKELDKKEEEDSKKTKRHKKLKNERLGQKFEQSDPIYCLSSELPSNLRQVTCPMSSIVREQLESFQSRLMVEPTSIQVKKRKYKKKTFDRKVAAEQEG